MKRKIIAPLLALATACCALGFTACADEPETPPEKEPEEITQPTPEPKPEVDPSKVTEEQWKSQLAILKGIGEIKNYTMSVSEVVGSEVLYQMTELVDFENFRVYCPINSATEDDYDYLIYSEIYNKRNIGEYPDEATVYDYRELFDTLKKA